MPNGGYPMHFLIQIPSSALVIHADGANVKVNRIIEPRALPSGKTIPQYESIGTLSTEQICGLLYHLNYWGIDTSTGQIENRGATFHRKIIQPAITTEPFHPTWVN